MVKNNNSQKNRKIPTIIDVADHAGVSTATVDRVLNRRGGVRDVIVKKVITSAQFLDYPGISDNFKSLIQRPMRLLFILPSSPNRFLKLFAKNILLAKSRLQDLSIHPTVETVESFNPEILSHRLKRSGKNYDGVIFMALEHPLVRDAVDWLDEHGVPVVTIISDIAASKRVAYIGLDNRAIGRTAGYIMGRFIGGRPSKVAMIAGSLSYRAHEEREMGFMHVYQELFRQLQVLGVREGYDDPERNYRQTKMLLSQHTDIAGIYCIGGSPEGVGKALQEARKNKNIVFIGHGLTPQSRNMLLDGTMDTVITQNPETTLMQCVNVFLNIRANRQTDDGILPIQCEIIFRDNLPENI
jgi:LacI family transcriptional regulator